MESPLQNSNLHRYKYLLFLKHCYKYLLFLQHMLFDVSYFFSLVVFMSLTMMQVVQKEREEKLADILKNRLHLYVQGNKEEFIQLAEAEVTKLSNAGRSSEKPIYHMVTRTLSLAKCSMYATIQ
jgi:hypothetical protein